jgi:AsmA-like C-terminal region
VTFQKFHSTFFPHPGSVGEGVAFRQLGSLPNTPAIVTVQRFTIEGHYIDIILRPGYLSRITMKGFRVYIPPLGTPRRPSNWQATKSIIRVDEIIADGASIEIARADGHAPLRFDISKLKLGSVSQNTAMSYKVTLHNPLPPGEIRGQGQFGPWSPDTPSQTPVRGKYTFQNADLGVFAGIAGMLSAEGNFQGILGHIESQASIDIPDFMVTRSKHSVHVAANFNGSVNGINGDVQLKSVTAAFLKTQVLASGEIVGLAGQHGKTASIDMTVHDGRIQDVLRLFVSEPKPPLDGVTTFRAHAVIPPGKEPFVQKVRLSGDFGIESGQFAQASTQENVDALSNQSRGVKPNEQAEDEDPERVISNFAGHVELRDATATFTNASFEVPGASARMHGTYNLQSEVVNLHGTLKTEAELSKMTSGFKSALLKPFDIFFKRKHAGAVLPVHLIGTYKHAQAGLDLP